MGRCNDNSAGRQNGLATTIEYTFWKETDKNNNNKGGVPIICMCVFPIHIERPLFGVQFYYYCRPWIKKNVCRDGNNGLFTKTIFFFFSIYRPQWKLTTFRYDCGPNILSHKIIINKQTISRYSLNACW